MNCDLAREALSARIDGEREPVPATRVDEHVAGCEPCRVWQAAAVDQTQLLRRAAGRSQLAAVRPPGAAADHGPRPPGSWQRLALAALGVAQVALAAAQGSGADLGLHHAAMAGHVLNESTAWSAALGVAMLAAAIRPAVAVGLACVLGSFAVLLSAYLVADAIAGRVTIDRALTHLPVLGGAVLALLVWRQCAPHRPTPDAAGGDAAEDIVLPGNASRGRRRSHLRPSDGSAA